jgi:hypothetical protein
MVLSTSPLILDLHTTAPDDASGSAVTSTHKAVAANEICLVMRDEEMC